MQQYLGQHFLKNKAAIEKIVAALDLKDNDVVIEVGPGHGELTFELAKYPVQVIGIEKDRGFAQSLVASLLANAVSVVILPVESPSGEGIVPMALPSRILDKVGTSSSNQGRIPRNDNGAKIKIIEEDILKFLPELSHNLKPKAYKLVGNIPYYLTGFLFRTISELEHKPSLIVFTIQKEVAERICAMPPRMNLLAASIQVWARPEIIGDIPASDFEPAPKVTSAIIKLETRDQRQETGWLANYYKLIRIIFKQPRKTLLNNLADGLDPSKEEIIKKLDKLDLTGQERGQNLSIEQLVRLTEILNSKS